MIKDHVAISSLSMDLKRVALGYFNGSRDTARRFSQEALKRRSEVREISVKPYLRKFLSKLPNMLNQKDESKIAEDALMYSTIFRNYTLQNR